MHRPQGRSSTLPEGVMESPFVLLVPFSTQKTDLVDPRASSWALSLSFGSSNGSFHEQEAKGCEDREVKVFIPTARLDSR